MNQGNHDEGYNGEEDSKIWDPKNFLALVLFKTSYVSKLVFVGLLNSIDCFKNILKIHAALVAFAEELFIAETTNHGI